MTDGSGTGQTSLRLDTIGDRIGLSLGPTAWETVDQDRIDLFAQASGDTHWIHTDPEKAARETPFGGTLAHGYFTLSQVVTRLHQLIVVDDAGSWLNYGVETVRFPAPVPAGARIRYRFRLEEATPRGSATLLRFACETEIENGAKPAMTATILTLAFPKTGQDSSL